MEGLPFVEFELLAFLKIVWFLVEFNHTQERIERNYLAARRPRWITNG